MGLEFYFTAFLELTSCRTIGFGVGPIPWLAIIKYCEIHEVEGDQRDDLIYHVQVLDGVYLDWENKKAKDKK